ncbi:hypothetical protein [Achromobacter aloeverae]
MSSISIDDCDVQILIMVDEGFLKDGSTRGVYMMDNRAASGSVRSAATLPWQTNLDVGENICWRIRPVNPQSKKTFTIDGISNCAAWGYSGHPGVAFDGTGEYTGTAETGGNYSYTISITISGGDRITDDAATLTVPASLSVRG